jgi:hypothetical protein
MDTTHMKLQLLTALAGMVFCTSAWAQPTKSLLHERELPVVATPSFLEPWGAPVKPAPRKMTPQDGVLSVLDIPAEKHIPVLQHKVGLADAVIECDFCFDGPGSFLVGCDSTKHVGRVVINATGMSIAEDSTKPSHTIAKVQTPVKQGQWHHLRVEWRGDQMAARLDEKELRAQHPFLATPKARSWIAANQTVKVRNLTIRGETAKPAR